MIQKVVLGLLILFCLSCEGTEPTVEEYFVTVNKAELEIVRDNLKTAADYYNAAFKLMEKPFGKDVYNAIIVNSEIGDKSRALDLVGLLVNNMDDLTFIETNLKGKYFTAEEWKIVVSDRQFNYDKSLRQTMDSIKEKDQLFRSLYNTHMDTIEKIRKENLQRIFNLTTPKGLPSHYELGYPDNLRDQDYLVVLHHTAQMRSQDKGIFKLDSLLYQRVNTGRLDPELAIQYLAYQNDPGEGPFEVYPIIQLKHPLLPDSLQKKLWRRKLTQQEKVKANSIRWKWSANSLDNIVTKAQFIERTKHPFIFSSVNRAIFMLREDLDKEQIMDQYKGYMEILTPLEKAVPKNKKNILKPVSIEPR